VNAAKRGAVRRQPRRPPMAVVPERSADGEDTRPAKTRNQHSDGASPCDPASSMLPKMQAVSRLVGLVN